MFEKHRNPKQENATSAAEQISSSLDSSLSAPVRKAVALIGSTVRVKGEISSEENLVIEGRVEGNVHCDSHELTVGGSGILVANVSAKMIRIEGSVEGDIAGHEKVIITRTGKVRGNIIAPAVTLEDGAKFKGSIDMDPSPQQPAAVPLKQRPASAEPADSGVSRDKTASEQRS